MSHLPGAPQSLVDLYHTDLHAQWQTPEFMQLAILKEWGLGDCVIGCRIATGEATEVYRVYDGSTDDLQGYLRIAHRNLNFAEIVLMEECLNVGLPSVGILHAKRCDFGGNGFDESLGVTLLAPAEGVNVEEGLRSGEIEIQTAEVAFRNAGRILARIHELSVSSTAVADLVDREHDIYSREKLGDFWSDCFSNLHRTPGIEDLLESVSANMKMLEVGFAKIVEKYPLVLNHADFDLKHIYCDPDTGEITSIIDFGEAHVSVSHADLVHWRTYSPDTYPFFLEGYLEERFGSDIDSEQDFLDELDLTYAVYQLKWATNRAKQGIKPEAIEHLVNCVQTCEEMTEGIHAIPLARSW